MLKQITKKAVLGSGIAISLGVLVAAQASPQSNQQGTMKVLMQLVTSNQSPVYPNPAANPPALKVPLANKTPTINTAPAAKSAPVTTAQPAPAAAPTPPAAPPVQSQHVWNLQDADIRAVIDAVSKATGKNFIVDPHVQGKITIVSNKPIGAEEAYQVFLSSLQVLGYSAVPSGDVIKIVPSTTARSLSAPISNTQHPGQGDEFIVTTVHVKNVAASQLVPILQPLIPEWSFVSAYVPTNTLILSGQASNINRLVNIVNNIDDKATNETQVVNLKYASANRVLAALTTLQTANRASGKISSSSFAADPQANSIIINGTPEDVMQVMNIINQLDKPGSGDVGMTQVIYLNYLDAKKFAPILAKIAHSSYTADSTDAAGKATLPATGGAATAAGDDSEAINKQVAIQAEPTSNAIIISAPAPLMANLKAIVAQLDVQPKQVLVEAVIAQVDEKLVRELGIQWGVTPSGDDSSSTAASSSTSSAADFIESPGSVGFIKAGSLRVIVDAINSDNSADILSTPSIAVLDNQKAEIQVGKIVPMENRTYATSTTGNSDNNTTPFTTVEQKPVVLKLTVMPQISPNQYIRLNIKQTNDTLQNPDNPGLTPIINTSNIKTNIMVKSGEIVVLGGLISHQFNDATQKVPILGDIPMLGGLFRYKDKSMEKLNLLVFLRPIILAQNAQVKEITTERYNMIRQQQLLRSAGEKIVNENNTPLLPSLKKSKVELPSPFEP